MYVIQLSSEQRKGDYSLCAFKFMPASVRYTVSTMLASALPALMGDHFLFSSGSLFCCLLCCYFSSFAATFVLLPLLLPLLPATDPAAATYAANSKHLGCKPPVTIKHLQKNSAGAFILQICLISSFADVTGNH